MKKRILFIISFCFLVLAFWGVLKPSLFSDKSKALRTIIITDFQTIRIATQNYIEESNSSNISKLKISDLVEIQKGFLRKIPLDPWGNEYILSLDQNGDLYISTFGKDGIAGGVGNDTDITELLIKSMESDS